MRYTLFLLLLATQSFSASCQSLAFQPRPANQLSRYYTETTNYTAPHVLTNVGTGIILGGVVTCIVGVIEVKKATTNYGPYTITNEGQANSGHALEFFGGAAIVGGAAMVITAIVLKKHQKVKIVSPKGNEVGLGYSFR